jgi:hypothetical protein
MKMNQMKQILQMNDRIFDFLTWLLLISFLVFIFIIGCNVSLNTDDLYLLNLFKSHTLLASFEEFPHNFRIGSYTLFFFIFKYVRPENLQFYLGFYFVGIFLFCLFIMQFALKKYQGFFKASQLTFWERIKIGLYFLCFSFYFSETLGETWFWSNAILTYFLPFYFAIGISVYLIEQQRSWKQILIVVLGNFYIGGSSESFALTWFFIQFLVLAAANQPWKEKRCRLTETFVTLLPICLNLLTLKINNRLQFETENNKFRFDLFYDLRGFYLHFDRMDFLALLLLLILFLELKLKNWQFNFPLYRQSWWMILLASFLISFSLNIFIFKGSGSLRLFNNLNQVTALFLFAVVLQLASGKMSNHLNKVSLIFLILSIPYFFNYFFGQVKMTTYHRTAYLKRLELLKSVVESDSVVPLNKLPDSGITVFCDVSKSPKDFSNTQLKLYYGIRCEFYKGNSNK